MTFTNEQLTKAKAAKTAEELLEMAAAEGIAMTEGEAEKYFDELNKQGELTDDELDAVAGGKGDTYDGYPVRDGSWSICRYIANKRHDIVFCDQCEYFRFIPNGEKVGNCTGYCTFTKA